MHNDSIDTHPLSDVLRLILNSASAHGDLARALVAETLLLEDLGDAEVLLGLDVFV